MEVDPQQRLPAPRSLLAGQSLRKGRRLQGYFSPITHPIITDTHSWRTQPYTLGSAMERAHIK